RPALRRCPTGRSSDLKTCAWASQAPAGGAWSGDEGARGVSAGLFMRHRRPRGRPCCEFGLPGGQPGAVVAPLEVSEPEIQIAQRSEEHTSELQSPDQL